MTKEIDYAAHLPTTAENCTSWPTKPRVVVWTDIHGNMEVMSDGGEVEILIIEDKCPRDRVYRLSNHPKPAGVIDALIGEGRIGVLGDMPGTEDAVRAYMGGLPKPKPNLKLVEEGGADDPGQ